MLIALGDVAGPSSIVQRIMPESLEERVAYLEGRVSDKTQAQQELREMIVHLDQKVDRFREELAARIYSLEQSMNARFESIDKRFEAIDKRFESIDRRFEAIDQRFEAINGRIDALDDKVSRQFMWLVGIQITVLVAVVSALIAVSLQ